MSDKTIKKVLIANRGEITTRIIRTLKEMGIKSVAVYSEIDRMSPHVLDADEAHCIGEASPLASYLDQEKILAVARKTNADAIHPGYGFLAENASFAQKVKDYGLIFIGPSPQVISSMGDKVDSRVIMSKAGVPVIPGTDCLSEDDLQGTLDAIRSFGFPVMIKASGGGGGKGMRVVHKEEDLKAGLDAARREAFKAFGSDRIYVEKLIQKPRHIEFQVLADHHGNVIHVNERECSIQRRHQKIIEESPSTALDAKLRQEMGNAAVLAAKATGYTNAGTVEFILDGDGRFYFLEMNTRLQVEHPITELCAGLDLVREQVRIAMGEPLSFTQEQVASRGHAMECRLYAEDPQNKFLPAAGHVELMVEPRGPGVRNDCGILSDSEVSTFYDPLISKLVTHGATREECREKMVQALKDYVLLGIKSNREFLVAVLQHPDFRTGKTYTDFIELHKDSLTVEKRLLPVALLAASLHREPRSVAGSKDQSTTYNPWVHLGPFEIGRK